MSFHGVTLMWWIVKRTSFMARDRRKGAHILGCSFSRLREKVPEADEGRLDRSNLECPHPTLSRVAGEGKSVSRRALSASYEWPAALHAAPAPTRRCRCARP